MARTVVATLAAMMAFAGVASAQDAGKVGVTMGYPASIGVIWHVSDRVALRPEVALQQVSSTSTSTVTFTTLGPNGLPLSTSSTTTTTNDQWTIGVGASALFYIKQGEAWRTYVSPRFLFSRSTSDNVTSPPPTSPIVPATTEFAQNVYFVSGSFGAQYALGSRFGLYGEIGLGYSYQTASSSYALGGNSTGHTVSTRSGVGVLFYF